MTESDNYTYNRLVADAWCAAFVWKKQESGELPYLIHEEVFRNLEKNPLGVPQWLREEISRLARQYLFFHFYLAFPDVFWLQKDGEVEENPHSGWSGGFDVVLGNPPWERIKLQEKEWFAVLRPDIANAPNAAVRRRMIENLENEDAPLCHAFWEGRRQAEGESHFVRNSGKFPLCGRGDVNTYTIFAETNRELITSSGRVGCIVPSGIATDDTTKYFFQDLIEKQSLASLYDFENRKGIFPGVHRSYKFSLLTLTGKNDPVKEGAEFMFFALDTTELKEKDRLFKLTSRDIALVNPNSRTCPIFRYNRDAELVKKIYGKIPVLIEEEKKSGNPWSIKFLRMIDMANDSYLFKTKEELLDKGWNLEGNIFKRESELYYPLYEAKMIHHFNHRFGDYNDLPKDSKSTQLPDVPIERLQNAFYTIFSRYWINFTDINDKIKNLDNDRNWFAGFRDITNSTNERTVLFGIIPKAGVGHTMPLCFLNVDASLHLFFAANMNSFVFDFVARQKIGGTHLTYFILKQLPVPTPATYSGFASWEPSVTVGDWITPRVLELTYTAWDLEGFARDCGYEGPPFIWDEERRFLLRSELDAAYFHLYGIATEDVDYIMDTFPIVKRKDQAKYGSYRTKEKILEIYEKMAAAIASGKAYETVLDPPPADPKQAHPGKK